MEIKNTDTAKHAMVERNVLVKFSTLVMLSAGNVPINNKKL